MPDARGPAGVTADTIVARSTTSRRRGGLREHGEGLAAVIVEPVVGNMGSSRREPGFLEASAPSADATGALLVFDEVMTGFRVARGGAQERYGVTPDLTTLGKIVGGGLPAAAYGGRRELMEQVAPAGPSIRPARSRATRWRPPPASPSCGDSSRRRLRRARAARCRLEAGLARFGTVQRVGGMLTLFCHEGEVVSYEDAAACDTERFGALFRHLLDSGVYVLPSQFECLFPSLAHTDDDVDRTSRPCGRSASERRDQPAVGGAARGLRREVPWRPRRAAEVHGELDPRCVLTKVAIRSTKAGSSTLQRPHSPIAYRFPGCAAYSRSFASQAALKPWS